MLCSAYAASSSGQKAATNQCMPFNVYGRSYTCKSILQVRSQAAYFLANRWGGGVEMAWIAMMMFAALLFACGADGDAAAPVSDAGIDASEPAEKDAGYDAGGPVCSEIDLAEEPEDERMEAAACAARMALLPYTADFACTAREADVSCASVTATVITEDSGEVRFAGSEPVGTVAANGDGYELVWGDGQRGECAIDGTTLALCVTP